MNTQRAPKRRRQQLQNSPVGFDRLEPRAMLAAIANFNPTTGLLSVEANLTPVTIVRAKFGQILVNGQEVGTGSGTATSANTTRISISSTPGFDDSVTLNLARGFSGPSGTIPFDLNLGSGSNDTLNLLGSGAADNIRVLATGIDLNNDSIVDVKNNGARLNKLNYFGGNGNDFLFFDKAGENFANSYFFDGQAGTDRLTFIGTSNDDFVSLSLLTGSGNGLLSRIEYRSIEAPFTLVGGGGNDQLIVFGNQDAEQYSMDEATFGGITHAVLRRTADSVTTEIRFRTTEILSVLDGTNDDVIDFSSMTTAKLTQTGLTGEIRLGGGQGQNTLRGTQGRDTIHVGGNDVVDGLEGDDEIIVQVTSDILILARPINGGAGSDKIRYHVNTNGRPTEFSADLSGTNPFLEVRAGAPGRPPVIIDRVSGCESFSIENNTSNATFQSGIKADLSQFTLVEAQLLGITEIRLVGGILDDTLIGSGIDDFIDGQSGNDQLEGKGGNDEILGGSGNDNLLGANGNDTLLGGIGDDSIFGGPGNDVLSGDDGNDQIRGGDGDDTLLGGNGDDQLFGENGNDTLNGGPGNNFLDEGPGQGGVVFNGTPRNDVIYIGRQVIDGVAKVVATINGVRTVQPYANGETIIVQAGAGHDRVVMEDSAGEKWQAVFHGGDGNDTLRGAGQDDLLFGDAGNDRLFGEGGQDVLAGGDGDDRLFGGEGRDLLIGGRGRDWLFGFGGEDLLIGGFTSHDNRQEALRMLLAEWNGGSGYEICTLAIRNGTGIHLAGSGVSLHDNSSVTDDGETDRMFGQAGRDFCFAGLDDRIYGGASNELLI